MRVYQMRIMTMPVAADLPNALPSVVDTVTRNEARARLCSVSHGKQSAAESVTTRRPGAAPLRPGAAAMTPMCLDRDVSLFPRHSWYQRGRAPAMSDDPRASSLRFCDVHFACVRPYAYTAPHGHGYSCTLSTLV